MNDQLKLLLKLQEMDKGIDRLKNELERIPVTIEEKRSVIKQGQTQTEEQKKRLVTLQLKKKEKEMELASHEEKIRKHEGELNSLKSNDSYRAMLAEIGNLKEMKGRTEDEILNVMEESDHVSLELKGLDSETKNKQKEIESEIAGIEQQGQKLKTELGGELKKKEEFLPQIPKDLLSTYDYIRSRKKGIAIVFIEGESCKGCNTILTPSTINEAKKGKDLVRCDSCSRILITKEDLTEVPSTTSPASPV